MILEFLTAETVLDGNIVSSSDYDIISRLYGGVVNEDIDYLRKQTRNNRDVREPSGRSLWRQQPGGTHKKGKENIDLYPTANFNVNGTGINTKGLALTYKF